MGVPTVTLSTKAFEALGRVTARGRKMPALQQIILPFPLETEPEAYVRSVARTAFPEIVRSLKESGRPSVEVS